jgi:protein-S-isoprenylcysteine O-methyltransferase Ste14
MRGENDMPGTLRVLLAVFAYGVLHSLLASGMVKDAVRRRFGLLADRLYRLCFNAAAVMAFIPVLAVTAGNLGPVLVRLPWPWWAVVEAGQLAALSLFAVSFLHSDPWYFLGLRQMGTAAAEDRLVTTGAYGIVRHPLYTTGLLILWCFPILTTGTLAFDLGVTLYILAGSELEERRLIARYGEAYVEYRSRVARLIPFLF